MVLGEANVLGGTRGDGSLWIVDPRLDLTPVELGAPSVARMRETVAWRGRGVLVADRLGAPHRRVLAEAGWHWWDRRGTLRVATDDGGLTVTLPGSATPELQRPAPFLRPVDRVVGAHLLLRSGDPVTVRSLAAETGLSRGAVGEALHTLAAVGLFADGVATDLPRFAAALADRWRPAWHSLTGDVGPTGGHVDALLRFGLGDGDRVAAGWAVVGERALTSYGAPPGPPDAPLRLLVPDERALAWAVRTFGVPAGGASAVEVAVAPAPVATMHRRPWGGGRRDGPGWRLARPEVVALAALASDDPEEQRQLERWRPSTAVLSHPLWRP